MRSIKLFTAFALAAAMFVGMSTARADEWNKKTIVSFSAPVEIPGHVVLPAGQYVMKLMDSNSNRHIVQFWNRDENKLLGTVFAISKERMEPTGDSVFGFYEMQEDSPAKLESWFYPGRVIGDEFAYPKQDAMTIAKVTGKNVPVASETSIEGVATPDGTIAPVNTKVSSFAPAKTSEARVIPATYSNNTLLAQAQQPPAVDPGRDRDIDQPATTPNRSTTMREQTDPNQPSTAATPGEPGALPATASYDPLLLATGCMMLLAAFGIALGSRRRAASTSK